jgi:tRNA (adenine57-N1/adenine58-N1)-methyltransferase
MDTKFIEKEICMKINEDVKENEKSNEIINNENNYKINLKNASEEDIIDKISKGDIKLNAVLNVDLNLVEEEINELQLRYPDKRSKIGDVILTYEGRDQVKFLLLEKGKSLGNNIGTFPHESLANRRYGERIYSKRKDKYFIILQFLTNIYERCLTRLTQILFNPDISLVLSLLNINKDSIIYESGTGSGCLSTNMAQILNNGNGHLYTLEFNKERQTKLNEGFKVFGFENTISCIHRDVIENGFELPDDILVVSSHAKGDGIFVDLPNPWDVVDSIKNVLRSGGALVSFSPCIEQVEKMMKGLRQSDFINCRMYEIRYRSMGYSRTLSVSVPKLGVKRKSNQDIEYVEKEINVKMNKGDMRGHTGFLVYAIRV